MAPSCKIELARFSARQRIQDGAECGNSIREDPRKVDMFHKLWLGMHSGEFLISYSKHVVNNSGELFKHQFNGWLYKIFSILPSSTLTSTTKST